ncbi:MAG TPA: polyprenyl synthetase family protein [Aggregatilinea sp.]|uniref:polyprenyl synthetase family protein n=1 Tax=Aggregatilinea sp. TaxID=2806333 RepID=UPI002C4D3DE6|nr:polyprenyl synthetase family protein [Aggregatilinea sp.]HML21681.1 polyprenyl synthetase family protein [Aggregatilinea sp.]
MALEDLIKAVDEQLLSVTQSSVPVLQDASHHILAAGGKRLRPRLVLLANAAVNGPTPADAVPLAVGIELIHTATLVHDDINDHGTMRRGRETVNARWGGTVALLTGDFMFTKVYQLMATYPGEINAILADATATLVEGETLQILASKQGTLDRDTYMEIIAKKTASLFVAAVELGATIAHAPAGWVTGLKDYAFNLGLAFQIEDDILDLSGDAETLGKNAGIDVAQGRGLAVAMQGGRPSGNGVTIELANDSLPAVEGFGDSLLEAVTKGREKAREYADLAVQSLDVLPASPARDALRALAYQAVNRDH